MCDGKWICIQFRDFFFKIFFHYFLFSTWFATHNHKSFAHENQPFWFMSFWGQDLVQNFITELQHWNNHTWRRICFRETTIQTIHGNKKTSSRDTDTICSWKPTKQTNKHTIQVLHCDNKIRWMIYQWETLYRNEGRAGASLAHLFSLCLTNYTPPPHYPQKKL